MKFQGYIPAPQNRLILDAGCLLSPVSRIEYLVSKLRVLFISFFTLSIFTFMLQAEPPPQRIISLAPSLTEELYSLGIQDKLIACTTYCAKPPEAKQKTKIGTVVTPNLEKMVSLQPDLVISSSLTNSRIIDKLKSLGIEVVIFPYPKSFSEICKQFLKLGEIVGKEEVAQKIVQETRNRVNSIHKQTKKIPQKKVFVQIGSNPLYTVTRDTYFQDLITLAGGINVCQNTTSGFYSREKVLEDNPEIIFIATMGMTGEQEKATWEQFNNLEAVRRKAIFAIDSERMCSPIPQNFILTLEEMFRKIHPQPSE